MGIRDRIRAWGALPDLPPLAEGEQLLLSGAARRLPIGLAGKSDYFGVGQLGFSDRRLIYIARVTPRDDLGDARLAWQDVAAAKLQRGPGKFLRAPRPYVFAFGLRNPMFTLTTVTDRELRFQLFAKDEWGRVVDQLRILYPALDGLAGR